MICTFEILPDGEIFDISYEDEQIVINDERIDLINLDDEDTDEVSEVLSRKLYTTYISQSIVYTLAKSELLKHLSLPAQEVIFQALFRLAEDREMIDKVIIDITEEQISNDNGVSRPLPKDKDFKTWDARKALKDLVYD